MNPITDATESTPPESHTPAAPPASASGRFSMTSAASRPDFSAMKRSRKIPATTAAPTRRSVRTASSALSNWPPYSTWYPRGIVTFAVTASRTSRTTLPRSRPETLDITTDFRWTFSRVTMLGPRSLRISASALSGICAPEGLVTSVARTDSRSSTADGAWRTTRS
jgi:hypothetical protein